jgi:hypothetical protein
MRNWGEYLIWQNSTTIQSVVTHHFGVIQCNKHIVVKSVNTGIYNITFYTYIHVNNYEQLRLDSTKAYNI